MDAQLTITGYAQALDKLTRLDSTIFSAMQTGLRAGLQSAVQTSQQRYLSGPRPFILDVITGRLRQSITSQVTTTGDSQVTGTIGSNVRYAAFHEYGFHGTEQVGSFTRNGKTVRAHSRQMTYAGRPFLAPAIKDSWSLILQDIKDEVRKALSS